LRQKISKYESIIERYKNNENNNNNTENNNNNTENNNNTTPNPDPDNPTNNNSSPPQTSRGFVFHFHIVPQSSSNPNSNNGQNNPSSNPSDTSTEDTMETSNEATDNQVPNDNDRQGRVIPFAIVFEFDTPVSLEASFGLLELLGGRIFNNATNHDDILNQLFQQYQPRPQPATSKQFLASIPEIEVSSDMQELCTVCQDVYKEGDRSLKLPCNHMYHKDCIVPWLESHNTCPTCRYILPTEQDEKIVE